MKTMSAISVIAGIDVAKAHVDVDVVGAEFAPQRYGNDCDGHSAVASALSALGVGLVVMEATGGYERGAICAMQAAGLAVARVNPRQARDFAKSMGVLAKTDQVDARTLRDFADVLASVFAPVPHKKRVRAVISVAATVHFDIVRVFGKFLLKFMAQRVVTTDAHYLPLGDGQGQRC